MVSVADAEVDMADISATDSNNAEMIIGNKTARLITWNDLDKTQFHLTKR